MHGVPKARAQVPMDTFRFSKWARKASHSSSVGIRYSSGLLGSVRDLSWLVRHGLVMAGMSMVHWSHRWLAAAAHLLQRWGPVDRETGLAAFWFAAISGTAVTPKERPWTTAPEPAEVARCGVSRRRSLVRGAPGTGIRWLSSR